MMESIDIDRYLDHSGKIDVSDLDWSAAKGAGLTDDERLILTYFSDIEAQTIYYLRDLLNSKVSRDPDSVAFLSMWNYEEYFHARVLARLLAECGYPLERNRFAILRAKPRFREKWNAWGGWLFSKIFPGSFLALYMTWGAINELTTLRGYEQLERTTKNTVFRELCRRIAKQERKHFAWYFNSAREKLSGSRFTQRFTRLLIRHLWAPVGSGVKSDDEVHRLMTSLFYDKEGTGLAGVAGEIDEKISSLPGLQGLIAMRRFAKKASKTYEKSSSLSQRFDRGGGALRADDEPRFSHANRPS